MSKFSKFNYIVVGGRSAGVVLAARLSEDARQSVLLLEAGPAFRPGEIPRSVRDASNLAPDPQLLWDVSLVCQGRPYEERVLRSSQLRRTSDALNRTLPLDG